MTGRSVTNPPGAKHFSVDPEALDRLEEQTLDQDGAVSPITGDFTLVAQAFDQLGRNVFLLSKAVIKSLINQSIHNKGTQFVKAGSIDRFACDGNMISARVKDGSNIYYPALSVGVNTASCGCPEVRSHEMCSHIAALMLAWNQNFTRFVPPPDEPVAQGQQFMSSPLGKFIQQVTKQSSYPTAMSRWCTLLSPDETNPAFPGQSQASTGAGFWPTASQIGAHRLPLRQIIDQEYNATQLRELGRWLNMKLKGASKSILIDQVIETLEARVKNMRQNPDALLEGLPGEYADFVRRLLTARDHDLSMPRNQAKALWAATGIERDKAFGAALDELRRRAILFPTLRQYDVRDVYYQWLPLDESRGNIPLTTWPQSAVELNDKQMPVAPADTPPFLDAMNLFVNAVLATGTQVRASLPRHPKANSVEWLRDWEHDLDEAEQNDPQFIAFVQDAPRIIPEIVVTLYRAHRLTAPQTPLRSDSVGRNDPCPCGSGLKYKKCHGA